MADSRELQILLTLKDQVSGGLKETSKASAELRDKVERVQAGFSIAAVAGTAAFATIAAGIYKAVTAAGTLEQAEIAFTTMLGSGERAKKMLQDLSDFAQKTPFELTGIRQTAKQLLAFGITQEEMIPTLKMLGDVASGVSVPIEQVAYAYGQVRTANQLYGTELRQFMNAGIPILDELARMYGVTASEAKKMVEEGKVSFEDVEKAFGNMTGAGGTFFNLMDNQSASFLGKMSNLSDSINKFMEDAGKPLLEQFKPIVEWLIKIVNVIGAWVKDNPKLAANLVLLAGATAGLVAIIGILGVAITGIILMAGTLGIGMAAMAGIFLGIPLAIAAIIAAGYLLYTHWDQVKEWAIDLANTVAQWFQKLWGDIVNIWNSIISAIVNAWNNIVLQVNVYMNQLIHDIMVVWGTVTGFFSAIWETIGDIFQFALNFIAGLIVLGFQAIGIDIVTWIEQVKQFFIDMWNFIKEVFAFAWQSIKELIQTSLNIITGIFNLWKGILIEGWRSFWTTLSSIFTGLWSIISGGISAGWKFISDLFNSASKPVNDAWTGMWNSLSGTFSRIWGTIKDGLASGINWMIDKINAVIRGINQIASAGSKLTGGSIKTIGEIPKLAKGGIVTSPTLALIGEAGSEAVIPLDKMNKMGGITVNITGNTLLDSDAAEMIGDRMIKKLQLNALL